MAPFIVLLVTFAIACLVLHRRRDWRLAGRIALAAMLVLTGTSHFTQTAALAAMVPPLLPYPTAIIYATGVVELALALLILVRGTPLAGWAAGAFFVAVFPANVYSAVAEVGLGGHGPAYLWFRAPLQLLFIGWALVSTGAVRALSARRANVRAGWYAKLPGDAAPRRGTVHGLARSPRGAGARRRQ